MKKLYTNKWFFAVISIFIILTFWWMWEEYHWIGNVVARTNGEPVNFNIESGFYDENLCIKIHKNWQVPVWAGIYYTLNGDDPQIGEESTMRYSGGVNLELIDKEIKVYPLKVAICYPTGDCGAPQLHTYILGENLSEKIDLDVVSLVSDRDNLYDYNTGIMVPGIENERAMKMGQPDRQTGNYSYRDEWWLRGAQMTIFSPNGEKVAEQPLAIGIAGSGSAGYEVKSFKLAANKRYGFAGIDYDFYQGAGESEYNLIKHYNTLRLRSGSQDMLNTNIKAGVASRLAEQAGFDGYSASKRVTVYLNGEFRGIYEMQQPFSSSFLAKRFNLDTASKVKRLKIPERDAWWQGEVHDLIWADLSESENRGKLEARVDMDNFLKYYALNILWQNNDWPGNNFSMWRYEGDYNPDNPYTDGQWRFLIFDVDWIWTGSESNGIFDELITNETLEILMEKRLMAEDSVFSHVMESEYYRDKFLTIVQDLYHDVFQTENVLNIVEDEKQKIEREYRRHLMTRDGEDVSGQQVLYAEWERQIEIMKEVIRKQPDKVAASIEKYFGKKDTFSVSMKTDKGSVIKWVGKTLYPETTYNNDYYSGTRVEIRAETIPGWEWDTWIVNGEELQDEKIIISEELLENEVVTIEAKAKQISEKLIINELAAADNEDYVIIKNVGAGEVRLADYCLTDGEEECRYQLPDILSKPGEEIRINGKNNRNLGTYSANFGWSSGEVLYLRKGEEIVERVVIPRLERGAGYRRYRGTGEWRYFIL